MKESTFKKHCLVVDEWTINGFNGSKAYQKFYPDVDSDTAKVNFSRMLTNANVLSYKEETLKTLSKELHITRETQVLELTRLKGLAEDVEKYNDAINALKEQNKLLAFYEDHNKQKNPASTDIDYSKYSVDELKQLQTLLKIGASKNED